MANEAFWVDGGNYVAEEFRRLLKTFYYSADPLGGVISGLAVVQGAGSSVKVQVGAAFVNDSGGGAYIAAIQADSAAITITPASSSPRTDRVYAIINDPGSGATAGEMAFGVAVGSSSIPSLAIPLADVTANTDGTLTIVDRRVQVQSGEAHSTDTGWVPVVPLKNDWLPAQLTLTSIPGSPTGLLVRRRGKTVQLVGGIFEGAGWTFRNVDPHTIPAVLPAWATPLYSQTLYVATNNTASGHGFSPAMVSISGTGDPGSYPAGTIRVFMPPDPDGADAALFNMTWLVE